MSDNNDKSPIYQAKFPEILKHLGISRYDFMVVCDGSGFSWDIGAGWGAVVIDRASLVRQPVWGALSHGTVGIAELIPVVHALLWYDAKFGKDRRKKEGRILEGHVISDCENVVNQGRGTAARLVNAPLWAAIDSICRLGYSLTYHFLERETIELNSYVDELSKKARVAVELRDDKGKASYRAIDSPYGFNSF